MEDHEELLPCSDEESSESEEQCFPTAKPEETERHTLIYFSHTKLEFLITKLLLLTSTTIVLISFPLYMESVDVAGDVYSIFIMTTVVSILIFASCLVAMKMLCSKFKNVEILKLPIKITKMIPLCLVYVSSGFAIMYALDRKRVSCHLQDPIKGVVLMFSLIFYFIFSQKFMGLQRICSATTVIVGLFIAIDYGLCDEFRCRGYERKYVSEDGGNWSLQIHSAWTTVYIFGLALFGGYFTLLERHLVNAMESHTLNISTSLLSTVSRSVSNSSSSLPLPRTNEDINLCKKHSAMHLSLWLHLFCLMLVCVLFWTDFTPQIGKAANINEFFNNTIDGIICHFSGSHTMCSSVALYSWIFMISYAIFVVMSIKFLILSQSAVYTAAVMTSSLPVINIWWSLVHVTSPQSGSLIWAPAVTGELICSLLGLPVVLLGLFMMCRSHFKDYQWSKLAATHVMSSNHLA